jgi:hypothetical protein
MLGNSLFNAGLNVLGSLKVLTTNWGTCAASVLKFDRLQPVRAIAITAANSKYKPRRNVDIVHAGEAKRRSMQFELKNPELLGLILNLLKNRGFAPQ